MVFSHESTVSPNSSILTQNGGRLTIINLEVQLPQSRSCQLNLMQDTQLTQAEISFKTSLWRRYDRRKSQRFSLSFSSHCQWLPKYFLVVCSLSHFLLYYGYSRQYDCRQVSSQPSLSSTLHHHRRRSWTCCKWRSPMESKAPTAGGVANLICYH